MRAVWVLALLAIAATVQCAVIDVTTPFDSDTDGDGECSLREAIRAANAGSGGSGVDCEDPELDDPVEINLGDDLEASGLPEITAHVDLTGSAVIHGIADGHGIFSVSGRLRVGPDITVQEGNTIHSGTGGCFTVRSGGTLLLDGSTVRNCRASNVTKVPNPVSYVGCAGGVYVDVDAGVEAFGANFEYNFGHSRHLGHEFFCAGAVYLSKNASELIENTRFHENHGDEGGAVWSFSSLEMLGCSFTNNTAWPGSGGALYSHRGDIHVEGDGLSRIAGNRAEDKGGAFYARGEVSISKYGALRDNVARGNGGVAHAEKGSIRAFHVGSIIHNLCTDGSGGVFSAFSDGVWIDHVDGDISYNAASDGNGGVVGTSGEAWIHHVRGSINHNYADSGAVAYGFHVEITEIRGEIAENSARFGSIAVASDDLRVQHIHGPLRSNVDQIAMLYSNSGTTLVSDIDGGIIDNISVSLENYALIFGHDGLQILNINGDVRGNVGGQAIAYSFFNQIVVRNITGSISDNSAEFEGGTLFYSEGGMHLEGVGGEIANNKLRNGAVFHGDTGLTIVDVNGAVRDNVLHSFGYDIRGGFASSDADVLIKNIGPFVHNTGGEGLLAYGGHTVLIENIGGDIADNVCAHGSLVRNIAESGSNTVMRNIRGSITRNTIMEGSFGGIVYAAHEGGNERGFVLENVEGDLSANIIASEQTYDIARGASLFYIHGTGMVVRNVGNIQDNIAPGGVFVASESITLSNIKGNITRNVASSSQLSFSSPAAVAYSQQWMVVENVAGEVTDNIAAGGSIFRSGEDFVMRDVAGDISRNTAGGEEQFECCSSGSVLRADGGLVVERVDGEFASNVGEWAGLAYGQEYVTMRDIGGGIRENEATGTLVWGGEGVLLRGIGGPIRANQVGEGLSSTYGMFYAWGEGGVVVENVDGAIEENYAMSDLPNGAVFYGALGGVVLRNIGGSLRSNWAPFGLMYSFEGDFVIEDVRGSIRDNHATEHASSVAYGGGSGVVNRIAGPIRDNANVGTGGVLFARGDLVVQNIDGGIYRNVGGLFFADPEDALIGSEASLTLRNVSGSIVHNTGGAILYADDFAVVSSIAGEISDNLAEHSIVSASIGGVYVVDIAGGIARNRANENGGIVYTFDADHGIVVDRIDGGIVDNWVGGSSGGIVFAGANNEGGAAQVSNVNGDLSRNVAPEGIVYGTIGVRVVNVGEVAYNTLTSDGPGGVFYGAYEAVVRNTSAMHHNDMHGSTCFVYGAEAVDVSEVRGGFYANVRGQQDEDAYGFFYASGGSVALRSVHGPLADNVAGSWGGVAYAEESVLIADIGGDIRDNSALAATLAYALEGNVLITRVHGGIVRNTALGTSLAYADGGYVHLEYIYGDIADNKCGSEYEYAGLLYAEGDVMVREVFGNIRGNVGVVASLAYSSGSVVVNNVYGGIYDNFASEGGAALLYGGEDVVLSNVHGSVHDNWASGAGGGLVYAVDAGAIFNIRGDMYDNGCNTEEDDCVGGLLYGGATATLQRVNGSIWGHHAASGAVVYGDVSAVVADVAGDIRDNTAYVGGGVLYSDNYGRIQRVGGSVLRNRAERFGGGVALCRGDCALENVAGHVSYNVGGLLEIEPALQDGGGVIRSIAASVEINNVGGSIAFNRARSGGVAYGDEAVAIRNVAGDIRENYASYAGGVGYARSAGAVIEFVKGDLSHNVAYHGGVLYASDTIRIQHISGSVFENEAGTDQCGGVAYAGSAVSLDGVAGDISRNRAGFGGVLYGDLYTEIHDVGGDISDNFAMHVGGVLLSLDSSAMIHDVEGWIEGNFAGSIGGVVYADEDGQIENVRGSIAGNAAGQLDNFNYASEEGIERIEPFAGSGGVIYAEEDAFIRNVGGDITENHAGQGGVVLAVGQAVVSEVQGNVCDNFATIDGGVVVAVFDHGLVERVQGYICSNRALTGRGGVIYASSAIIREAGIGICSNEAFLDGGVLFAHDGSAIIHSDSTKITLNQARQGLGGVAFVSAGPNNDTSHQGSIDVGTGYVSGNRDSEDTDPRSLKADQQQITLDFDGADLPEDVEVEVTFDGADAVANEFITPAPVVNVTAFAQGIPLDFVIAVERDGLPAYYYPHDVDVEILPFGSYRFNNITLPEGDYRLAFLVVEGCGNGGVIASSNYTEEFSVSGCEDPHPIVCPSEIIHASSDAFTCGAYVVVDDIQASPDCDNVEFTNDYNSVTVGFNERGDGSASDVYPVGATDVLLTVSAGSASYDCPVRVIVEDEREFTSMTCPFPVQADTDAGVCTAQVTVPLPTAIDNCPVRFENNINAVEDASDVYPVGTTRVTFEGINDGPGSECSTTVVVTDREAPVITCPADFATTCEERDVFFQVSAEDNCVAVAVSPVLHDVSPLGGVLDGGVNRLTYEAEDAAGNTAQCSFVTTVESTYYRDADGDGFGDPDQSAVWPCNQPEGWVLDNTDCNDFNAEAWKLWFIDFDGDGFGNPAFPVCSDSNGTLPDSFPLSKRDIRGVPGNDTTPVPSASPVPDASPAPMPTATPVPGPQLIAGDELDNGSFDCDDSNPFVHPAAPELCDGIDNNCDGQVDEADNCPQSPPIVPVPVDVPVPVPVPVPNPVPNPVPVPVPVPVPYVVEESGAQAPIVFSVSASGASALSCSFLLLWLGLMMHAQ
eukprot:TRINITY_DN6_c0_g1_i4.p1 TRINITY_DN6_c0_g1~~TRINITY_DN6_c0_g1_i4.p1  ORF type:complete len:2661 (-),score=810.62 TRINITY_DN6_c0_g1_i4:82-8064(-)